MIDCVLDTRIFFSTQTKIFYRVGKPFLMKITTAYKNEFVSLSENSFISSLYSLLTTGLVSNRDPPSGRICIQFEKKLDQATCLHALPEMYSLPRHIGKCTSLEICECSSLNCLLIIYLIKKFHSFWVLNGSFSVVKINGWDLYLSLHLSLLLLAMVPSCFRSFYQRTHQGKHKAVDWQIFCAHSSYSHSPIFMKPSLLLCDLNLCFKLG